MGYIQGTNMEKRIRKKYVKVRMEDDLYAALKLCAKKGDRPMTRQVEHYVKEGIERDRQEAKESLDQKIVPGQSGEESGERHRPAK